MGVESDASDLGGESIVVEDESGESGDSEPEPGDDPGLDPEPPPLPPPGGAPPVGLAGLVGYGRAPTSRAACGICGKGIEKGTWRVEHRMTNTMHADIQWNIKRIHTHCVPFLPAELKRSNFVVAQDWSNRPGLGVQEQEFLDELVDMLGDKGHAASSGLPSGA